KGLRQGLDGLPAAHEVGGHDLGRIEVRQQAHQLLRLAVAGFVERPKVIIPDPSRSTARRSVPHQKDLASRCRTADEALEQLAVGLARESLVCLRERDPAQLVHLSRWRETTAGGLHRPPANDLWAQEPTLLLEVPSLAQGATETNAMPGLLEHL